ncbi:hypothetical protein JW835_05585 [bacterium]|nr:hypothetical protein [bacterium]
MKAQFTLWTILTALILCGTFIFAEDSTTVTAISDSSEGLDLQAVSELFKESESLEAFEKSLNDPEVGINNLDLDENGEVDYIRVLEEVNEDAHIIILQASLGEDEYQDVAVIEVEKDGDDYTMQVVGNEDIYGPDYYIMPSVVHVKTWPIIAFITRPGYKPYRSVYRFGVYPKWWKPFHPVARAAYRNRLVVYHKRAGFRITRTGRVRVTTRVKYRPASSVLVKRKVVRTPHGTRVITTKKKVKHHPAKKKPRR